MADRFREWLSDNLRYILLGLAVILLLVIAFFAVKFVTRIGSGKKQSVQQESGQVEGMTEDTLETAPQAAEVENKLVREAGDSALHKLITQYYTAVAAKDYDTLDLIDEDEDDKAEAKADTAIESYNNIITYSKKGLTDGAYIVYIYFEAKITGIDVMAPSLREKYVVTNADGALVIGDKDSSEELKNYILSLRADADVQALIEDVDGKLATAKEQSADLAAYVDSLDDGSSGSTQGGSEDGSVAGSAATGTMKTTTGINVRGEPSADSTLYGTLMEGMEVEVLKNLDGGWSNIRYTVNGTTIEGYVMTQYLTADQ